MRIPKHDRVNKALICIHSIGNVIFSILFIAQLEVMNFKKPFSSPILPAQIAMIAIFSFYVANLSFILSCSVQATVSCKFFSIMILLESLFLFSGFFVVILLIEKKFRVFCIQYGLLLVLNYFLHFMIRMRLYLSSLPPERKEIKKLLANVLTRREVAKIESSQNCSICLGELKGQKVLGLPCSPFSKHYFHQICFLKWFSRSRECPVCRQDATLKSKVQLVSQSSGGLDSSLSNWRETVQ